MTATHRTHEPSATAPAARAPAAAPRVSGKAAALVGSEILKIAAEIRAMTAEGKEICNLTVGDFSPAEFRIPEVLEERIEEGLRLGETNYPPSNGVLPLREAVRTLYRRAFNLDYPLDGVLVTGGARPGIYGTYWTLLDPGDRVVYPVPSWNNNHYCHAMDAAGVPIVCTAETDFLPTREQLAPVLRGARLLALNSPLNPTGTAFDAATLGEICDLVLEENERRGLGERPLYLMYDQVYWMLTFGATVHVNPVALRPEIKPYTVLVDGISKAFAATGLRVGWVVGPTDIVKRMGDILGHMGAWAPRAEQLASAQMLESPDEIVAYHATMKAGVQARLDALYDGVSAMRRAGLPVEAIEPMGAIYLSVRFALNGARAPNGQTLRTNEDIRRYLLTEAGFAAVPFQAFGSSEETGWFRLSVGAVSLEEIEAVLPRVRGAVDGVRAA